MLGGFKNFILRGNLIDLAVAVIIGASFAAVVTTFTNWLTAQLPDSASEYFSNIENSFGAFLNAVISFVILAAIVYFFIVTPYTKALAVCDSSSSICQLLAKTSGDMTDPP